MTGAEIIALVSVLTTGATALGAPWLTERLGQRRFALETRVSREDELREKLDAAATRLGESIQRLRSWSAMAQRGTPRWAPRSRQTTNRCR